MISTEQAVNAVAKYIYTKATRRPKLVNLEITKLCNATCDFCDYWQTRVMLKPTLNHSGKYQKI